MVGENTERFQLCVISWLALILYRLTSPSWVWRNGSKAHTSQNNPTIVPRAILLRVAVDLTDNIPEAIKAIVHSGPKHIFDRSFFETNLFSILILAGCFVIACKLSLLQVYRLCEDRRLPAELTRSKNPLCCNVVTPIYISQFVSINQCCLEKADVTIQHHFLCIHRWGGKVSTDQEHLVFCSSHSNNTVGLGYMAHKFQKHWARFNFFSLHTVFDNHLFFSQLVVVYSTSCRTSSNSSPQY